MNKENVKKLITFFKENPEKVDMSQHMNLCGTSGCISGWSAMFWREENPENCEFGNDTDGKACDWLGIDYRFHGFLFYPNSGSVWIKYCKEKGVQVYYDKVENAEYVDYQNIPTSVVIRILTELVEEKLTLKYLA